MQYRPKIVWNDNVINRIWSILTKMFRGCNIECDIHISGEALCQEKRKEKEMIEEGDGPGLYVVERGPVPRPQWGGA